MRATIGIFDDDDDVDDDDDIDTDDRLHTLAFKCIGVTRETGYQVSLKAARDLIESGQDVPVKLEAEPSNKWDPNALSFKCLLNDEHVRIGYVVKELLDEVHQSIKQKKVVEVKFSWIKYCSSFAQSGPGFYARISITKNGCWSSNAINHRSSRY